MPAEPPAPTPSATTLNIEAMERRICTALGLFASAIRGGEEWTPTCQSALDSAHTSLDDLMTAARAASPHIHDFSEPVLKRPGDTGQRFGCPCGEEVVIQAPASAPAATAEPDTPPACTCGETLTHLRTCYWYDPPPRDTTPAAPSGETPEPRSPKPHSPWTPTWEPKERPWHRCDLCGATDTSLTVTPEGTKTCFLRCGRGAPSGEEAETEGCWAFDCETASAVEAELQKAGIRKHPDEGSYSPEEWARRVIEAVRESERDAQATELAALREAARFYADPMSWKRPVSPDGSDWPVESSPVEADGGDKARAALAPHQTPGDER